MKKIGKVYLFSQFKKVRNIYEKILEKKNREKASCSRSLCRACFCGRGRNSSFGRTAGAGGIRRARLELRGIYGRKAIITVKANNVAKKFKITVK